MTYTLTQADNFILKFEKSVKENWDLLAVEDFRGHSFSYGELATEIEKLILMWKAAGLQKGDKIAINARSCSGWAKVYFAAQAGEFVSVQLFNGFTPADTTKFLAHSEARILYTEKGIFDHMHLEELPEIIAAIDLRTGELLASRGDFEEIYDKADAIFAEAHPNGLTPEDIHYPNVPLDSLSSIMYTSGSTGNPKGVMLTNRAFSANIHVIPIYFPYIKGDSYVSVLPYAHIFGMTYDMIAPLCLGMHLTILGMPPIPAYLKPALRARKPRVFFAVPLILTKLIEDSIGEFIHSKSGAEKLEDYKNNPDFCEALAIIFMKALGGHVECFVTGGAAIPEAFEKLFVEQLKLPFVTGYGMTEAAPTICLGSIGKYKLRECGEYTEEVVDLMIDSPDPENVAGEILIKGDVLFSGYYKNPDATEAVMTKDGWFRTGDLATMDKDRSVFIVGRCKSMILSTDGLNIYPEEIEVLLNALPYVAESLIVSCNNKLTALIVPDANKAADLDSDALNSIMTKNIEALNKRLPVYSQVATYALVNEPFAKTPKGSIKRFMYA